MTSIPPLGLVAFPVTELAGPVVAFNLLVIVAIPLSGWAAFVVCRRLTGRFWASLAGGAVYGFSAYELNLSCPNTEAGGREFGFDPVTLAGIVTNVRRLTQRQIWDKLPPAGRGSGIGTPADLIGHLKQYQDAGVDQVVIGAAVDRVVAAEAIDDVVAAEAVENVVARGAVDDVVAGGAGEGREAVEIGGGQGAALDVLECDEVGPGGAAGVPGQEQQFSTLHGVYEVRRRRRIRRQRDVERLEPRFRAAGRLRSGRQAEEETGGDS